MEILAILTIAAFINAPEYRTTPIKNHNQNFEQNLNIISNVYAGNLQYSQGK